MQWNMEVQPTSNYCLGMALQVYIEIRSWWPTWRHGSYSLEIGHTDLFGFLRFCSLVWTQKVLQAMWIVFLANPFWEKWGWNFPSSIVFGGLENNNYRFGEYKLSYMVCHVLLEGQGWSPDHPDWLPLSLILVWALELCRRNLWQSVQCMKFIQNLFWNVWQKGQEWSLKLFC